jgi:hypothetical protein
MKARKKRRKKEAREGRKEIRTIVIFRGSPEDWVGVRGWWW